MDEEFLVPNAETTHYDLLVETAENLTNLLSQACDFKHTEEFQALIEGSITEDQIANLRDRSWSYIYEALTTPGAFYNYKDLTILDFCLDKEGTYLDDIDEYIFFSREYIKYHGEVSSNRIQSISEWNNEIVREYLRAKREELLLQFTTPIIYKMLGNLTKQLNVFDDNVNNFIERLEGSLTTFVKRFDYQQEIYPPKVEVVSKKKEYEHEDGTIVFVDYYSLELSHEEF
jgi:hypothetical protein